MQKYLNSNSKLISMNFGKSIPVRNKPNPKRKSSFFKLNKTKNEWFFTLIYLNEPTELRNDQYFLFRPRISKFSAHMNFLTRFLKMIIDFRSDDTCVIRRKIIALTPKLEKYQSKMRLMTWTIQKNQRKGPKIKISNFMKTRQIICQNEALDLSYSKVLVLRPFKVIWGQKSGRLPNKVNFQNWSRVKKIICDISYVTYVSYLLIR